MDPQQWMRAKALFQKALEQPDEQRDAFVVAGAAADATALADVRALLAAHRSQTPLAPPIVGDSAPIPALIGPYRPLRVLGRGGMGVVYLAERVVGGFAQQLAIKVIAGGFVHEQTRRRFEREREILARLSHPHIARLLDGGVDAHGAPFIALEYIDGTSIDQWCDSQRLDLRSRLRLLLQVMDAVDFAHRNLIVHRDLKPSNILVSRGSVRLLDFGIARLLDLETPGDATNSGARAMTPDYAAPEQLAGATISTATDVYGLGLLMFELLCGRLPFAASGGQRLRLAASPGDEAQSMNEALCRRVDPGERRNSTAQDIAQRRSSSLGELQRGLRGELGAIVAKALSPAPEQRFPSVAALAADIRAFLDDRPLAYAANTRTQRLRKFLRRHRLALATASVVTATALAGLGATLWQARAARQQAQMAAQQAATANAVRRTLTGLFSAADPDGNGGAEPTVREALDAGVERIDVELADQPAVRTALLSDAGAVYSSLGQYERAVDVLRRATADSDVVRDLDQAVAVQRRADALIELSDHAQARQLLQALAPFFAGRDPLEPAALDYSISWVTLERESDHGQQAHRRVEQLIDALSRAEPPRPAELARALDQLGDLLMSEHQEPQAVEPLTRARELLQQSAAGPVQQARADAQLARALVAAKREAEGIELLRQSLHSQRQVLGADNPSTLNTLNKLALALQHFSQSQQARPLFEELVEARTRRFGADHPSTAVALNNLAVLDYGDRRYEAAAEGFAKAHRIWSQRLGEQHDSTLSAAGNLAGAYAELGKADQAVILLDQVVAARRARSNDNMLYSTLVTRGLALEGTRREDAALRDFREASAIGNRVWPDDPAQWVWSRALLGRSLRRLGQLDPAQLELEAALVEYSRPRYASGGPRKATALIELALTLDQRGREPARALQLAQAAQEMRTRLLGAQHADTVAVASELARLRRKAAAAP